MAQDRLGALAHQLQRLLVQRQFSGWSDGQLLEQFIVRRDGAAWRSHRPSRGRAHRVREAAQRVSWQ
jgi:hypothetical protein